MNLSDKKTKVVDILASSFQDNPSALSAVKNDRKQTKRVRSLVEYAVNTASRRGGMYLSSDEKGAALVYNPNLQKEGIADYWDQVKLILKASGVKKVPDLLKREAYIKAQRPKGNYLYFWFLGVMEEERGKGTALELKKEIFQLADDQQLDIYLETSVPKNVKIYERIGFEIYHEWNQPNSNSTLVFMRRKAN